jgi:HEAT repeat protein
MFRRLRRPHDLPHLTEVLRNTDPRYLDLRGLLARGVQDESAEVRTAAIAALSRAYAGDPDVELLLVPMLKDADEDVRRAAIFALEETRPTRASRQKRAHSPKVAAGLVGALGDPTIASIAARAIAVRQPDSPEIQLAILAMLREGKAEARNVHMALDDATLKNVDVLHQLVALLGQPNAEAGRVAAGLLQKASPADAEVQLELVKALGREDLGYAARDALERIRFDERLSSSARSALKILAADKGETQAQVLARGLLEER